MLCCKQDAAEPGLSSGAGGEKHGRVVELTERVSDNRLGWEARTVFTCLTGVTLTKGADSSCGGGGREVTSMEV